MSEQDMHLEPEEQEDVEAHANKGSHVNRNAGKDDDVEAHANKGSHINRNAGKDDDDVEGHVHKKTLGKDEDDDVEAHRNLNQNKF